MSKPTNALRVEWLPGVFDSTNFSPAGHHH
jgi:hypothetical protein